MNVLNTIEQGKFYITCILPQLLKLVYTTLYINYTSIKLKNNFIHNKRGHDSERPTHRDEEWPPLAGTRESPRTETKTQHTQK